ncbi:MAG: hypothetical protein HY805_00975 [Nitrospirae bacterium]|nr:hypothetical protein [Nitrospirota bacterium]
MPYTIKAKGCALTSLAMVMGIYGSEALPDEWNRFMLSGGYTEDARVRWDVPEYIGLASLSFSKTSGDDDTPLQNSLIDPYLKKCMPVIVKVYNPTTGNMHWVVVTGKSGNIYNINDPGYRNRENLQAYSNEIFAIRVYKKTGGCQ